MALSRPEMPRCNYVVMGEDVTLVKKNWYNLWLDPQQTWLFVPFTTHYQKIGPHDYAEDDEGKTE
eukprot:2775838-Pyramimonas_sp.AAC.1